MEVKGLRAWLLCAVCAILAVSFAAAQAETTNAPPSKTGQATVSTAPPEEATRKAMTTTPAVSPSCTWEEWCKNVKNPTPWLNWGADLQMREIYANNYKTLNGDLPRHEENFQRFRTRVWTTIKPMTDMEINARLAYNMFNFSPEPPLGNPIPGTENGPGTAFHQSEAYWDNLNIVLKNLFDTPSKLTLGRQDIILGDGWLVCDGTPGDGSRSIFFDAVRYTYDFNDIQTTADLIYIDNHAKNDRFLDPLTSENVALAEQDERGAILWLTNKSFTNTEINPYFMYKHNEKYLPNGQNSDIYAPGLRFVHKIDEHWRYRAEGAYEFGNSTPTSTMLASNERQSLSAYGFNSQINYFTNDEQNNNFRLSYEFLSGDRPGDHTNQGFDVLWGRWARWSDMYPDTIRLDQNNRAGDFTNYHRFGPGWSCNPSKQLEWSNDYYLLFADKNPNRADTRDFTKSGAFKGQMLSSVLKYTINKNIKGHLLGELYLPGNYYTDFRNDAAVYLRYEIIFTF